MAAVILIGIGRIVATYHVFAQTWDEPAHLAAGMEWLDRGAYHYEPLHPPLARVAVALAPYLHGLRSAHYDNVWIEGNALLHTHNQYDHNLALARSGVLPFFILLAAVVFVWTRHLFGNATAIIATLLLTTLPPILGHAAIATTDVAVASTVALAAYAAARWWAEPTVGRGVGLGAAVGLAVLSKFSALVFVPAAALAIVAARRFGRDRHEPHPRVVAVPRNIRWPFRVALFSTLLTIWAGYRFSTGPLVPAGGAPSPQASVAPKAPTTTDRTIDAIARASIYPAPALFEGIGELAAKNRAGQKSYLLGEVRNTGWWYFFPVAIAVKTPLAFLALAAIGASAIIRRRRSAELVPLLAALLILLVCLPSRINIGVRHILPIYPFLSIVAAHGAVALWNMRRYTSWQRIGGPVTATALVVWHSASSFRAHPDYLAYFNELAGAHPERILVDSDLDDGQDLKRLADTLRARRISEIALAYAGSATVRAHGMPTIRWLVPHEPTTGWIAASLYSLKLGSLDRPGYDDFRWLEVYQPVARIGKSIYLYYVPARSRRTASASPAANASTAKNSIGS